MIDIKATIQENGLTQVDFGKLIGRGQDQVNHWYNGRRQLSPMMEDYIRRICTENNLEIIEK